MECSEVLRSSPAREELLHGAVTPQLGVPLADDSWAWCTSGLHPSPVNQPWQGINKQLKDVVMSSQTFFYRQKHLGPFKPIKFRIFIEGNLLSYLNSTWKWLSFFLALEYWFNWNSMPINQIFLIKSWITYFRFWITRLWTVSVVYNCCVSRIGVPLCFVQSSEQFILRDLRVGKMYSSVSLVPFYKSSLNSLRL